MPGAIADVHLHTVVELILSLAQVDAGWKLTHVAMQKVCAQPDKMLTLLKLICAALAGDINDDAPWISVTVAGGP